MVYPFGMHSTEVNQKISVRRALNLNIWTFNSTFFSKMIRRFHVNSLSYPGGVFYLSHKNTNYTLTFISFIYMWPESYPESHI